MFSSYYAFVTIKVNLFKRKLWPYFLAYLKNLILYVWTLFVYGFETNDSL